MSKLEDLKKLGEAPLWLEEKGFATLSGGYLLENETPRGMWRRVSDAAAMALKKPELSDKFFELFYKGWLCGATPVLSNLGTNRGLPISCFSIHVEDSTDNLLSKAHELAMLTKRGGGVGIYMGDIRCAGSKISSGGTTEGVVPFAKIYDSTVAGISQGNVRRGAAAVYLPADHGDIEAFIRMRRPEGDPNRQCLNLHHGVNVTNDFMEKALLGNTKETNVLREIYKSRMETGEPYFFFTDNVQKNKHPLYKHHGLEVKTSNICNEVYLYTDPLHTFVCCLSSMNVAKWNEWKDTDAVYWATWFLEGVLSEFIAQAKSLPGFESSVRFAEKFRAIGLGVLGFHTLLQTESVGFDSLRASLLNKAIFKHIHDETLKASQDMAKEFGEPEMCKGFGIRHSDRTAVAPTASNSIIAGNVSAGIEPINSNAYTKRTAKGVFIEKNPQLEKLLESLGKNTEEVWKQISSDGGSVRSLDFLDQDQKNVFKTAFEIDQLVLVQLAADRQKYICQGQSVNTFFSSTVDPNYFHVVHVAAWEKGLNGLYYVRSSSVLKADLSSRGEDCKWCEA